MCEYVLSAIDHETGEPIEIPVSAAEVKRMMILAEGLPDPEDVLDEEGDDD